MKIMTIFTRLISTAIALVALLGMNGMAQPITAHATARPVGSVSKVHPSTTGSMNYGVDVNWDITANVDACALMASGTDPNIDGTFKYIQTFMGSQTGYVRATPVDCFDPGLLTGWAALEPCNPNSSQCSYPTTVYPYNWHALDDPPNAQGDNKEGSILYYAYQHNLKVLLELGNTPSWDSNGSAGDVPNDCLQNPNPCQDYGNFIKALVTHLATTDIPGTTQAEASVVEALIPRNEPQNTSVNWIGGTPTEFADLINQAHMNHSYTNSQNQATTIPVMNGGEEVIPLGLGDAMEKYQTQNGTSGGQFVRALYTNPTFCSSIDILDVHLGMHGPTFSPQIVNISEQTLQNCLGKNATAPKVWATEVAATSIPCFQAYPLYTDELGQTYNGNPSMGQQAQANFLQDTYQALYNDPNVIGIDWTYLDDLPSSSNCSNFNIEQGLGLMDSSYNQKTAYTTLQTFIQNNPSTNVKRLAQTEALRSRALATAATFSGNTPLGSANPAADNHAQISRRESFNRYQTARPQATASTVYVGSDDGNLYALNPSTGAQLWKYSTGGPIVDKPALANGLVYFGSEGAVGSSGAVYVLTAGSSGGQLQWSFSAYGLVASSPAVSNGVVYIGSNNAQACTNGPLTCSSAGTVYAINASTGAQIWSYTTNGVVESSPAVSNGVVYVGSEDGNVYALNATSGVLVGKYPTSGGVDSSPAVIGGTLYIGSTDNNVYAINVSNGTVDWKYLTGSAVESSPTVVNGIVYIGSDDFNVYGLNATTGAPVSSYPTGYAVTSSPAVANGFVYFGSDGTTTPQPSACNNGTSASGTMYALTTTNPPTLAWCYQTGDSVSSSPAVANGAVYIGSLDDNIYSLNASAGSPANWNFTTGGPVLSSPTAG
jgi:outer membrane protein assembly factor BamB